MSDLEGAVIGYGLAGRTFHSPLISATPGLTVKTVVTANPERREQALGDLPGVRVVPAADELWDQPDEHDFVVIATRNDSHAALARSALDAGLAAVVDKPLATSAGGAGAAPGGRGGRRQAARDERGRGGCAGRARPRARRPADRVPEPPLGLRPS